MVLQAFALGCAVVFGVVWTALLVGFLDRFMTFLEGHSFALNINVEGDVRVRHVYEEGDEGEENELDPPEMEMDEEEPDSERFNQDAIWN